MLNATIAPLLAQIPDITRCESVAGDIDMVLTLEAGSPTRLQDIRDELKALNAVLYCPNFVAIPRELSKIRLNTTKKRAKKSK